MKKNGRRRSEPEAQSQGLLGLLAPSAATPDRTAKKATVIRRTSTIGDVKVIDPRFMEAKAEKNNGTLEANCMKTANLEEQKGDGRPEVKGAGTDDQGTEGGDRKKTSLFQFDDPILTLYGTPSLDARHLAAAPIPSALLDSFSRNNERNRVPPVNQKLKEVPVSKRSGLRRASANKIGPTHENRDQKEAPLPLSTGLDYFAQMEQKDRFVSPLKKGGNKALESTVAKCADREADGSDEGSEFMIEAYQMRKDFSTRPFEAKEGSREVTFSEAARRATEECWDLVSSVFEWIVITLL